MSQFARESHHRKPDLSFERLEDHAFSVIDNTADRPDRATSIEAFTTTVNLYDTSMTPIRLGAVRRFSHSIQPPGPASVTQTPGTWPS